MPAIFLKAPLAAIIVACSASSASASGMTYHVSFNDAAPDRVDFLVTDVPKQALEVSAPGGSETLMRTSPVCAGKALARTGSNRWQKPAGCTSLKWSASLNERSSDFDASRPVPFSSREQNFALLTGSLPWLRRADRKSAAVIVRSRIAGRDSFLRTKLTADFSAPLYIPLGNPIRRLSSNGLTVNLYGQIPAGTEIDRLQRAMVDVLSRWRRDFFQSDTVGPSQLNYVWFKGSAAAEAGILASSGSDAILMQFNPGGDVASSTAKLQAGVLLTGTHEGFHTLAARIPGNRPTWINESWAAFFAYIESRKVLRGPALVQMQELMSAPGRGSILDVQRMVDAGDQSRYGDFYSKGTRFWLEIDKALTIEPNGSGRLAALIKKTNGMNGLNWRDPAQIAAYFDRFTQGKASSIVQCHLVDDDCDGRLE